LQLILYLNSFDYFCKLIKKQNLQGIYSKIIEIENSNNKAVLCTIILSKGSTPRKVGAKMLVYENGTIFGTIGGGALEQKIIQEALSSIENDKSKIVKYNLVKELEMCCGGIVEIFIEPIMNRKKIFIFGAGHTGKALAKFAIKLDFNVLLIDERNDAFEDINPDDGIQIKQENHITAIGKLNFDENTYCVILTHDHAIDREILSLCSKKKNAYIGMIGSERKVEIAKKMILSNELLTENELKNIDMPIGIKINAKTPEEISISILAKLIELRNSAKK
jgi:xanthine dehydrogenase accessory factor